MSARPIRGRVFVPPALLREGATVTLDATESHYLVRVRRAGAGDPIEALNGEDRAHAAKVLRAEAKACVVQIEAALPDLDLPPVAALIGIVDVRAFAEAIASASEAGAAELVPVRTARAQSTLPSAERIDKVRRAAQRQCGRAVPLQVRAPIAWAEALAYDRDRPGWVAVPGVASSRPEVGAQGCTVLIGPEGGLTADEVAQAERAGLRPLGLGPFVQRTPTAVVSALARLNRA